jgi:hypothetical protein
MVLHGTPGYREMKNKGFAKKIPSQYKMKI